MVEADAGAGVDVVCAPGAFLEQPHRLRKERHQDPVDKETRAGRVETITCLPISVASARAIAASVSSDVPSPRISSTSGITGTGLKKCIPTTREPPPLPHRGGQAP